MTYQELYERLQIVLGDDTTASLNLFKSLINETHRYLCVQRDWPFTEATFTVTSTAGMSSIKLPVDFRKMRTLYTTVGGLKYPMTEIASHSAFTNLTYQGATHTSDYPAYMHFFGGEVRVYPAISSAGKVVTGEYLRVPRDMTADNYSTGSVTDIANGGTTITATGTTFTTAMAGRYIRITSDGYWYKIASVTSSTVLELEKPYEGTTITAGTEAYTIAELPLIPEPFHDLLWYRPAAHYFILKGQEDRTNYFMNLYEELRKAMVKAYTSQTTQYASKNLDNIPIFNPNLFPTVT